MSLDLDLSLDIIVAWKRKPHAMVEDLFGRCPQEPEFAEQSPGSLGSGSCCRRGSPRPERFVSQDLERAAGGEMALDVEGVEDYGVNRQELLG